MSRTGDDEDFLGWAPEWSSWDAPAPATAPPDERLQPAPAPRPPLSSFPAMAAASRVPTQMPPRQGPDRARAARPVRTEPRRVSRLFVGFVVMLVITMYTALMAALGEDPQSSPAKLFLGVLITAVLGVASWRRGRRSR